MDMMHVVVGYSSPEWKNLGESLKEAAESTLLCLLRHPRAKKIFPGKASGDLELEINLVDVETMSFLNQKYKNKDGPATVLSFDGSKEFSAPKGNHFF